MLTKNCRFLGGDSLMNTDRSMARVPDGVWRIWVPLLPSPGLVLNINVGRPLWLPTWRWPKRSKLLQTLVLDCETSASKVRLSWASTTYDSFPTRT